jgi:hypothetical protein
MTTTETTLTPVELTVLVVFTDAGPITLDAGGRLAFPGPLTTGGAIYRLTLDGRGGPAHYFGETVNLARRAVQFRTPGPTQVTNARINRVLTTHLEAGGTVRLAVAEDLIIGRGGETLDLNLSAKGARVLGEHAALLAAVLDEQTVLNLPGGDV